MKLNSKYSFFDYIRLFFSLVTTKLIFKNARIVRQPCRVRGAAYMSIGKGFTTGQYCRLEAICFKDGKSLTIGNNVEINDRCHIAAIDSVTIGNNVLIASNVFISDHDHGDTSIDCLLMPPSKRKLVTAPVIIEDNVWIGENAVILKGVTVGKNSVIAACSVVTRSIPPFSVAAGIPAKIIKQYEFK